MRTLYKNANIVNVFTDTVELGSVLTEDEYIIGIDVSVSNDIYSDEDADWVIDLKGKYLCPGFIDSHIHIESTMLTPVQFAKAVIAHGTTGVVTDPHEIANVCGVNGMKYMLEMSDNLPVTVYVMASSCVPATGNDESATVLKAADIEEMYQYPRTRGLAEMMNYPGVLFGDEDVLDKINGAKKRQLVVNGHAPLLKGRDLDKYIAAGVTDDHECSEYEEALEKLKRGQRILIRQGTAAKNLEALINLFDEPYSRRCLLCTDDKHPADIISQGHLDSIIREAVLLGKSPIVGIRMATIQVAEYYGLKEVGAIAPGYRADMLVLSDLNQVKVDAVYKNGKKVAEGDMALPFDTPDVSVKLLETVQNTMHLEKCTKDTFRIDLEGKWARVIKVLPGSLFTEEIKVDTETVAKGVEADILKIAVLERHNNTGHVGLGYINGLGIKSGAIASTVSHDSHNVIVIGTSDEEMTVAVNSLIELKGGCVVVDNKEVVAKMPLPIAGLMSDKSAAEVAKENEALREAARKLGANEGIEPFMNTAFISLSVIPDLKITTKGILDVNKQCIVALFGE